MSQHSADPYASTGLSTKDSDNQSFVNIAENDSPGSVMELPKEENGSLLLSTITGQFPNAVGLKYKGSSGSWRGVRISGNVLDPPSGGWGNTLYYVTLQKSEVVKRKTEDVHTDAKDSKLKKRENKLGDIIVLGLSFKCTNEQLKDYFTNECGELVFHEVKFDRNTGKPRGFAFIRFKTVEAAEKALNKKHSMMGRTLEIRLSKKKEVPLKLFVGRIPNGVSQDELTTHFSKFGEISDVYMPTPMRGFGFVTFESSEEGCLAQRQVHKMQGARLNVVIADPQDVPKRNGGDDRDERISWENRRSGDQKEDRGLAGRGREDRRRDDDRGFWDIRADRGPRALRDGRDARDARIPREPRDSRVPRESRDSRIPRAREPREHRVPRETRDSRISRDPHHRESRDDSYQRDSDNRGPRDFRDPVERNPMEKRNMEMDSKKEELGTASLTRGHGERNRHERGVEEDFRDMKRSRTDRLRSAMDQRESRENNIDRIEIDRNRANLFGEERVVRNSYEMAGSREIVDQRHPHNQHQIQSPFAHHKFNPHAQHASSASQPQVTPEMAVRLKDMIYKFLGARN